MYRAFYGLKSKPFQISSDPAFLWLGEKHKEALATLRYGILDNKGFLLLTGDVGTGKTTLINTLKASLGKDVICTAVPDPSLDKIDFYNFVARGFGFDQGVTSKGRFLYGLSQFLHTAHANGKKVLLIIDEAQLLTQELLEEIRLLSNVELAETKLLNIFFIGQNEFNSILSRPENRAVRQRLTLNYNLEPLTPGETDEYIKHRLKVAGTTEELFAEEAVLEIYSGSQGFPRRINVLCDHALLTGYVRDERHIHAGVIRECIRELDIPVKPRQPAPDPAPARTGPVVQSPPAGSASPAPPPRPEPPPSPVPSPRDPVKTPEAAPRKGMPAYGYLVVIALLVFAGFLLFPHRVRTFFETADHYISGLKAGVSQYLSDPMSALPGTGGPAGGASPLPAAGVPILQDFSSEPVPETGETLKTVVETFPINDHPDPAVPNQGLVPEETTVPPNDLPDEAPPVSSDLPPEEPTAESHMEVVPPQLDKKVIVRFRYNSNDFSEQGMEALTRFADALVYYPETRIAVTGYTDSYGNQAYNKKLSEFRANIVKSFLLGKGAMPQQMETLGRGSENPIESNSSAWGRMMNRRVEIECK